MTPDAMPPRIDAWSRQIDTIITDVDGVLTDGRIVYHAGGGESKTFHVRDGLAMKRWIAAGGRFAIVTARQSDMVDRRAAELNVTEVVQGSGGKRSDCENLLQRWGSDWSTVLYVGDDVADAGPMTDAEVAAAPADACADILALSDWTTESPGGGGVLREIIETLMRTRGDWPPAV